MRRLGGFARSAWHGACLAATVSIAGCGVVPIGVSGPGVAPGPGQLPNQPMADNALPPVIKVADGVGPRGAYRAWVYRTKDAMYCFDISEVGSGSGTCGGDADGLLGLSMMGEPTTGITLSGGTKKAGAVAAVTTVKGGGTVQTTLAHPGAFMPADARLFVIVLPTGAAPDHVDIVDAAGTVLETFIP